MAWLLERIIDLVNMLAAWYYHRKYGVAARQLGRPPDAQVDGGSGFIVLEIDGLAHKYLQQALEEGYMPYLARLLRTHKLELAPWRCGLPSTTPASQAGILYGNNWDIPGFRWYDKSAGTGVLCKLPGSVRAIQERISAGRIGLLRGGSSYTNMFDGDARLSLFTLASWGREHLFENVRGFGFLILFALSPVGVARVLALSVWTWLVYVSKRLLALVRSSRRQFTLLGPLLEIANNVVFREITTFSVKLDIYRGMPCIYASYTGYDEIAHHFGADSREAFRALRGLDQQIHQIDRMRQLYPRRAYDLYILSDHGMTPSLPFRRAYGQTLQQFIATHTGQEVQGETPKHPESLADTRVQFLAEEIQHLEGRQRRALSARLLKTARQQLEERLLAAAREADWDLSRRSDIAVRNSGSLSHIYFNVSPRQMDLSEVMVLYPQLLEALIRHEGIGLVAGREGNSVVLLAQGGTRWLGTNDGQITAGGRLEGVDPLAGLLHPNWAAGQLARLVCFPHAGDLLVLGAWNGDQLVAFEEQLAAHGGLGGPQDTPFIAFPPGVGLAAHEIQNAEDVYEQLATIYALKREEINIES